MKKPDYTFTTAQDITDYLVTNSEAGYRDFSAKLIPNIDKSSILGVRTPTLRKLAKILRDTDVAQEFICGLPHKYLEENHLHGFLIENTKDIHRTLELIDRFLPYVDNWATCDSMRPKVLKKHPDIVLDYIYRWISSDHTYTVRYAVGLLLSFYLSEEFFSSHLELVCSITSDEYYINMMIAWYLATALCKQYDATISVIESKTLSRFVHNKAIQKATESLRISEDTKAYLRTLRIK